MRNSRCLVTAALLLLGLPALAADTQLVATALVEPEPYEVSLPEKVGLLRAARHREIAFEVSGRLERLAGEGENLRAGAVVAALDSTLQEVRLRQANIRLREARSEFERIRGLRSSKAVSKKALDSARAAMELAEAERTAAREELARRTLRAPFDGVVAETDFELDEVVAPGAAVARFLDPTALRIELGLPGYQVTRVEPGMNAVVRVPALGGERFRGVVHRVAPAAARGGHLFDVEIRVPNSKGHLRPGLTARMGIVIESLEAALLLPLEAVVQREGRSVVFFVEDGVARAVPTGDARVHQGRIVMPGSSRRQLVVRGQQNLNSGMSVRIDNAVLAHSDGPVSREGASR